MEKKPLWSVLFDRRDVWTAVLLWLIIGGMFVWLAQVAAMALQ